MDIYLPKDTIAQRIKVARLFLETIRGQKVSQEMLSRLCWERGQSRVGNYESGGRTPRTEDILRIAEVTGCRASWIMFRDGPMHVYEEAVQMGASRELAASLIDYENPLVVGIKWKALDPATQAAIAKIVIKAVGDDRRKKNSGPKDGKDKRRHLR